MKVHEKAQHYEREAMRRLRMIEAMAPLLNVAWTPAVKHESTFGTWFKRWATFEGPTGKVYYVGHTRYLNPQPSLGNRFDSYKVSDEPVAEALAALAEMKEAPTV